MLASIIFDDFQTKLGHQPLLELNRPQLVATRPEVRLVGVVQLPPDHCLPQFLIHGQQIFCLDLEVLRVGGRVIVRRS